MSMIDLERQHEKSKKFNQSENASGIAALKLRVDEPKYGIRPL